MKHLVILTMTMLPLACQNPPSEGSLAGQQNPQPSMVLAEGCATINNTSVSGNTESFYYNISSVRPSQPTYSLLNAKDKITKAVEKGYALRQSNGSYLLKNDQGRAVYPLKKALPVINSPYGFILVDGHHRALASMQMGATTIPIKIVDDYSSMSKVDFVNARLNKSLWPYDARGELTPLPCTLDKLVDDANRYFSMISARQCADVETSNEESTGAQYPLWVEVGNQARLEWEIARVLAINGLTYQNSYGSNIPDAFLERARQILTTNPIPGLCLVKKRANFADISNICRSCVLIEPGDD